MKNEMDLMNMDERQRLAWFMANRGTVIAIGAVWIGMIAWELTHGRAPVFLMIMIPVFALLRAGLYCFYSSRPFAGGNSGRDGKFVRYGKIAAAFMLLGSVFLPIYSITGSPGEGVEYRYVWKLALGDTVAVVTLAIVYLWPFLMLGLERLQSRRFLQVLVQFAEPLLAATSCVFILWIPQLIFESRTLFFILFVPANPNPEWGCYIAVAANGLYVISWLAGFLRPWGVQEG
jgi:hypothetical protein